jgi:hypothetical protein
VILIRRHPEGRFVGVISQPHSDKGVWVFAKPVSEEELLARFNELGSHPIDTDDVVSEANRNGFGYLPGCLSREELAKLSLREIREGTE